MSIPRFYVENLHPGLVTLGEQESRHVRQARRLAAGDEIVLFNGRGDEGGGSIAPSPSKHGSPVQVSIGQVTHRPRPSPQLTLGAALPKGPRQDWLIEKCTELGVAAIQPIITQRSIADASAHRLSRWRQTAIEAAKQSGQAWLPDLRPVIPASEAFGLARSCDAVFITCVQPKQSPSIGVWPSRLLVFIGPEGGWTPEELDLAQQAGARLLSLGPNTLRVETAAIAVASLVHAGMKP